MDFLVSKSIQFEFRAPYIPEENGAKRDNQIIIESAQ